MTINELVSRAKSSWFDKPYLQLRNGETLTIHSFGTVISHAEEIAGGLITRGIKPGDRIALLSENRPEWVVSYLAILLSGATVVPLDSLMAPFEIANVLNMARARMLITTRRFASAIESVLAGRIQGPPIFLMDAEADESIRKIPQKPGIALPAVKSTDLASVIFTSGTTGYSKGVMLSHGNLCGDLQCILDADVLRPNDNFHLLLPLHHTFSCTVNMLGALAVGARLQFATSYKSRDILDDIRITGITMLVGVPQVFENMAAGLRRGIADAPLSKRVLFKITYAVSKTLTTIEIPAGKTLFKSVREKAGLGTLRLLISGGAALPSEVNKFFVNLGFMLIQGYGLTETSPVLSVNLPGKNRIGSVGTALPGVTFKIENPDSDGVGEICAKGPMVMQGYFEKPDVTAEVLRDGWFHTGDAGYLDADGYLHITGRLKNVIITGAGKNVHPEEIEATLDQSLYILASLVVGVPRKRTAGEELAAILVPDMSTVEADKERGHEVDLKAELEKAVQGYNSSVPAYRRIRQWQMRNEDFEKTSTRKIKRFRYQDVFQPVSEA
jgi:long-chain acyl-CoA synthetase